MKLCSSAIRLSVLVLYVLLTLYAGASSAQEKKNLRVVFTGLAWNSELPFRVALARGFFKAQGLEVQPIFVRGGPAALAALSSGEVDFAEIGGAQAIMRSRAADSTVSSSARFRTRRTTRSSAASRRGPSKT